MKQSGLFAVLKKTLPCHPCPHRAPCCRSGTTLTREEAERIRVEFGEDKALKLSAPELRSRFKMNLKYEEFGITEQWVTTVTGDRCVFWNEGCRIHNSKAFPKSCRLYPWQGRDHSLQMPADAYVCPELGLPEPPYARAPIED